MSAKENLSKKDPIKHIVSLKFKKDVKGYEIENLKKSFINLQNKIPGVLSITGGKNNSPENLNKGFSHCFVITFEMNRHAQHIFRTPNIRSLFPF